jgi:peptide/nickel transport system substrate-binding protein
MVEADERFNVIKEMVPGTPTMFILNTNKPPLDDVNVRRALNMWLDRELINDTVWAGQNAPGYGPLTSNIFGYWPEVENVNALDREGALEVLADAGWTDSDGDGLLDKDGKTLEINIYSAGDYTDPPEAVEGQFVEMGADTKITMVPWSEQKRVASEGEPSMMVATFNSVDPRILRLLFHSENVGEAGWMWTQLPESDPELQAELDELLERGDMVTDLGERAQIYKDIQKLIVENALNLPMRADFYLYGLGKDVHGWNTDPGGWLLTYGMWKDQ